jgi:hypothetical protein
MIVDRNEQFEELRKTWKAPRELMVSAPREVELSLQGKFLTGLAIVMMVGSVVLFQFLNTKFVTESREQAALASRGRETGGTVTRLWRTGDKDRKRMVAYRFEAAGQTYQGRSVTPASTWATLFVGAALPVRFDPENPAVNHPRDWAAEKPPVWLPPILAVVLAAIGGLLLWMIRRQKNLLAEGRPAPAVVTRYSHAQHGQKNVHYEFPLMNGSIQKGRSGPRRKLPPLGGVICVLYDRENPRRSLAYPADLVRLAPR